MIFPHIRLHFLCQVAGRSRKLPFGRVRGLGRSTSRPSAGRRGTFCGLLIFLRLCLGDILNLFLYRGEQGEQRKVRRPRGERFLRRRRSGGLSARRLFIL